MASKVIIGSKTTGFPGSSGSSTGGSKNIGEIIRSTIPLTDSGLHLLDGSLILAGGSYNAFYLYMKNLYDGGLYPSLFTTEANWQSDNTNFGGCEKFVFTDGVSIRLPKVYNKNRFVVASGGVAPSWWKIYNDGWIEQGGLADYGSTIVNPVITVPLLKPFSNTNYTPVAVPYAAIQVNCDIPSTLTTSSFQIRMSTNYGGSLSARYAYWHARGYGKIPNGFEKPEYCYICLATSIKTDIEIDINQIATDLANKMDKDATNGTFENISSDAKQTLLNAVFSKIQNTDSSKVGYTTLLFGGDGTALYLPSGGTWLILSSFSMVNSSAAVYNFSGDYSLTTLLAGGSLVRAARSGHIQIAYIMRIQ